MKMLKKNNKGFTLIEIVIVIVIIAILAAMLVPSLLKWVDNANKKSFLEAANSIKTSSLSIMTENYAKNGSYSLSADDLDTIKELVGNGVTITGGVESNVSTAKTENAKTYNIAIVMGSGEISKMSVSNSDYTVTFEDGKWGDVGSAT